MSDSADIPHIQLATIDIPILVNIIDTYLLFLRARSTPSPCSTRQAKLLLSLRLRLGSLPPDPVGASLVLTDQDIEAMDTAISTFITLCQHIRGSRREKHEMLKKLKEMRQAITKLPANGAKDSE